MKIEVNFCTRKWSRLRMNVKILVNIGIRKVDSIAFKELNMNTKTHTNIERKRKTKKRINGVVLNGLKQKNY